MGNSSTKKNKIKWILGTILVIFIERLINTLIDGFPKLGKNVWGTIVNFIYNNASTISTNRIIISIIIMFCGSFFTFALYPVISSFMLKKKLLKINDNIESTVDDSAKKHQQSTPKIINNTKDGSSIKKQELQKNVNSLLYRSILSFFIYILLFTIILIFYIVPFVKLDAFNRDIQMIKPYTDSKTIMMLESDWTRMRSKDDYDKIYETINKIKDENDISRK